ncbi:hypothetical protein [Pontibacterium sp.]|uniref:hypothetical protein n=1 Tax=Pontibacterium sp. TaxID=2036026 RepID=UPI003567B513
MNGMKATLKVKVLAAKRFKLDGYEAAQLYVLGDKIDEQDKIGQPPMKLSGEFDVLDSLRGNIPGDMELVVEFRQGAKDKLEQYVVGASPIARQAAQPAAAK